MTSTPADGLVRGLAVDELQRRCADRNRSGEHERFCLELFRRAIVEGDQASWSSIYAEFQGLVFDWVYRLDATAGATDGRGEEAADLVLCAFTKLWRFYTPASLAAATGLGAVLAYLRSCAGTCVQEMRRARRLDPRFIGLDGAVEVPSPGNLANIVLDELQRGELWRIVLEHCQDDADRCVAQLCLAMGLKPAEVAALHPALFADAASVYRVKRNLLARLSRNELLLANLRV